MKLNFPSNRIPLWDDLFYTSKVVRRHNEFQIRQVRHRFRIQLCMVQFTVLHTHFHHGFSCHRYLSDARLGSHIYICMCESY